MTLKLNWNSTYIIGLNKQADIAPISANRGPQVFRSYKKYV